MLKYLRLFKINPKKSVDQVEIGRVFQTDQVEKRIHTFFMDHLKNSSTDEKVKNFKFQNKDVSMLKYSLDSFKDKELFELNSERIANKMKDTITSSVKNPFLLIIFVSSSPFEGDNDNILSILKMETSYTLQISNPHSIEVLDDVLPSSKTKLQKCAFVYQKQAQMFMHVPK